jgi:uncharacterized protein (DUF302 family)
MVSKDLRLGSVLAALLLALPQAAWPQAAPAAEPGLVTRQSGHSARQTIDRFEAAVRAKGWVVFTEIDHAAAAERAGLQLRPRTVIVFGNPRIGTTAMQRAPTLAIDVPLRALVWEDDAGGVWLTYNSGDYLARSVYPRHGLSMAAEATAGIERFLDEVSRKATE